MPFERSERGLYYLKQCKLHHKRHKTFSGNGCLKHSDDIIALAGEVDAWSALDYGCGKANQYEKKITHNGRETTLEEALGFPVDKYDPAVKQFAKTDLTEARDLVWCTDVMEHIPEEDIPNVIDELFRLAGKALFVTVATYPAKKELPNGENAHVCLKDEAWWRGQFSAAMERANFKGDGFKLVVLVD